MNKETNGKIVNLTIAVKRKMVPGSRVMNKLKKGLIFVLLQAIIFYILPLFAGPTDIMGLVFLQFGLTFVLSLLVGVLSKGNMKFVFPVIATVGFVPAVTVFYNYTAYIYLLFYAIITVCGVMFGIIFRYIKLEKKALESTTRWMN